MALTPAPADLTRDQALHMAKLSEQAERYEDMVKYMTQIINLGVKASELSVEERNLLSVGYKNMMSVRRTAFRTVQNWSEQPEYAPNADHNNAYKETISQEVFNLIKEVCEQVVDKFVTGANKAEAEDAEVTVFFKKMEGDYNRYGAEICSGATRETYKNAASKAYGEAQETAKQLPSTNPIRLGLALNFSVFHYEICDAKQEASHLAKDAFDTAIDHLDTLGDDEYKDSTLIMQLLKDNLTLWNEEVADDEGDVEVQDIE
jgi:14-3-3 protein epsilon